MESQHSNTLFLKHRQYGKTKLMNQAIDRWQKQNPNKDVLIVGINQTTIVLSSDKYEEIKQD